jgi:uncharacterized protein (TIRG00374 family)
VKSGKKALAAKIAVSVLCLGILIVRYGNDASLRQSLARLDPRAFFFSLGLLGVGLVLSALRWKILLAAAGVQLRLTRAVHLYFVGYFFNALLPTSVGGDVLRVWALKGTAPLAVAAGSVLVERILGFGCLLLLGLVGSFGAQAAAPARPGLALGVVLYALGLWIVLRGPIPQRAGQGIMARGLAALARVRSEIQSYGMHFKAIGCGLLLSFVWQGILIAVNAILSRGMGGTAPIASLLVLVPVVQALTMIPISLGGLGIREMGYEFFFRTWGFNPAEGVALGFAWLGVSMIFALLGGALALVRPLPRESGP